MIIDALHAHYKTLAEHSDSKIPKPGFATARVSFAFNLSLDGELLEVITLADQKGKRLVPVDMEVPEPAKRAGKGVTPCFLCDNSMYMIGDDSKGNPNRSKLAFETSMKFHLQILQDVDDDGAQAVCHYFTKWDPSMVKEHPSLSAVLEDVLAGGNIVLVLDGNPGYIHDRPKVKAAWLNHRNRSSSQVTGQCLVTGEYGPIARIHPSIKGVRGAQTSGAALVSFNLDAFTSYGKRQNFNAPLSEDVAFGYTTVLNHMLSERRQRLQLDSSTTVVFWSERENGEREENLLAQLFDLRGVDESGESIDSRQDSLQDLETTRLVHDVLDRVRRGQQIDFDAMHVDSKSRFFVLGLSPNSSRLSVRFWHVDTVANLVNRVASHHADLSIVTPNYRKSEFISVREILIETAPRRDPERIPPLLGGGLMRAVLTGQPYPQGLYTAMIARIRADREMSYVQAAVIKAALIRRMRSRSQSGLLNELDVSQEVKLTVSLDEKSTNPAYRLGRLFAVLEKVQQEANPGLNATIRDRYFGAASATPRAVFPQLLRLVQHHVVKAEYGGVSDRLIEGIVSELDDFPSHLSPGDQGLFMLGYYHQRQAFYQKSNSKE